MQPVDNAAQVMQVLRRQMAENLARLRAGGQTPAATATPATAAAAPPRSSRTLRQSIAQRIRLLDANDPRYLDQVAAAFVESVLLDEFGESLVNDAAFRDVMHRVRRAMLADADVGAGLAHLAAQLRKP